MPVAKSATFEGLQKRGGVRTPSWAQVVWRDAAQRRKLNRALRQVGLSSTEPDIKMIAAHRHEPRLWRVRGWLTWQSVWHGYAIGGIPSCYQHDIRIRAS